MKILKRQREYFSTGRTLPIRFRREALCSLKRQLTLHEPQLLAALHKDLGKSAFEGYETELGLLYGELEEALRHLKKWAKPKRVAAPLMHYPAKGRIFPRPLGVVLIIAPWNYPLLLSLAPLIGAVAAGNCVTLKCSEYAPHSAKAISQLIRDTFSEEHVCAVQGDACVSAELTRQRYDHIFFTGSTQVGRKVMQAAAENLVPVTLELGGKSPCIVDPTADLSLAARRIIWGKLINAGQTCVAPDYLLVHSSVKESLIEECIRQIIAQYGNTPLKNPEYCKIISQRHFERLTRLIVPEKIAFGGKWDKDSQKIEPTLLDPITWDDLVMKEEIFGPLLPVLTYQDEEELIRVLQKQEHPLALYLFSKDRAFCRRVMEAVSFGGGCIGDTLIHITSSKLPFGGVGMSGMGCYHGKKSFDTFTHYQSVMIKSGLRIQFRYPPYQGKEKALHFIMEHFQ